jgi:hypothetical protein
MLRLPGDLSNRVKDGLRGARFVFRRGTRLGQEAVAFPPAIPKIARLADSVLAVTERAAANLLLAEDQDLRDPRPIMAAFSEMQTASDKALLQQAFVRVHYRLAEAVLNRLGVENAFISAHEISVAYTVLRGRHRKVLSAITSRRAVSTAAIIRFWATAAICLEKRHPIRDIDLPKQKDVHAQFLEQTPATYCLLIMAITGATLTTQPLSETLPTNTDRQAYSLDDYIDSATSVVTARFDRLAAHFAAPEAVDLLAKDLEGIIAFLP